MKTKLLITCIAFFCILNSHADTDKYRIMISDDPSTTITVGWNQISGSNPTVYYDTTDHGTDHTLYTSSKTTDRTINYRGMNNNFARITGLTPNSAYYFVIKDDQGVSQRLWFKTAPSDNSRLSFIAGGDSRNHRDVRQYANTLVHKLKPHAVLFGGDMTEADIDSQWGEWFDDWQLTIAPDGRIFPIIPARGNHEGGPSVVYNLFDSPNANSYFAVTFGDNLIRTYTLNSEISVLGDQLTWLQNDLAASTNLIWKSAQYHKPMRPHAAGKPEGNSQYDAWAQLFYDKGVRLVVDSDSHVAKTTYPIMPSSGSASEDGFEREDTKGTVYTGEGCWGAPLRGYDDAKSWTRNGGSFNQFKVIFVDETKIELRTILVNNNASSVDEVSNNDPFSLPANLEVFSPPTGEVVVINKITTICPDAGTACDDGDSLTINDVEDGYCNCEGVPDCPDAGETCDDGDSQTINDKEDGNCNCAGIPTSATLNYQVSAGDDDSEEHETGGAIDISSSDLELVYDDHEGKLNQTVGIRFNDILIPKNANILEAYIQFTVKGTSSEATSVTIKGENAANSMVFTETAFDISSRLTTTAAVDWNDIPAWPTIDAATDDQKTPDLKTIVQEIVDLQDWEALNSMAFIITGSGKRTARSYNGSKSRAAKLIISYDVPESASYQVNADNDDAEENVDDGSIGLTSSDLELGQDHSTNQIVGIRFNSIEVPKNAEILSAHIQFTVKGTTSAEDPTSVSIKGEKIANSMAFSDVAFNISQRPTTTEAVDWSNIPVWSNIDDATNDQKTPDLKAIVQEIVNLQDWEALNSMSFIITGSGSREARSYDGSSSKAPKLVITYNIPDTSCADAGTPCDDGNSETSGDVEDGNCNCDGTLGADSIDYQVNAANDDAEENEGDGSIGLTSSDLELGQDHSTNQIVGIRFNSIEIPKNVEILSAHIQFTVKGTTSAEDPTSISIKGEKIANSLAFSDAAFNISQRPTTTETVDWMNIPVWSNIDDATDDQKTPDLKAIVQEIVDLQDWEALNSMSFIITGSGSREARSYDGSTSKAPKLLITYKSNSLSTSKFNKASIKIYPNPASHLVNIQSNKNIDNVSLYSILGQKVLSINPNSSVTNFDISQFKSGLYFIHIKQNNNQVSIKQLIIK